MENANHSQDVLFPSSFRQHFWIESQTELSSNALRNLVISRKTHKKKYERESVLPDMTQSPAVKTCTDHYLFY